MDIHECRQIIRGRTLRAYLSARDQQFWAADCLEHSDPALWKNEVRDRRRWAAGVVNYTIGPALYAAFAATRHHTDPAARLAEETWQAERLLRYIALASGCEVMQS